MLAEQHDEWTEGRRYLGIDIMNRSRLTLAATNEPSSTTTEDTNEPTIQALTA